MTQLLTDGYLAGLAGIWWLLAAILGVATIAIPIALGTWLLTDLGRRIWRTQSAWRLRTWPAVLRSRKRIRPTDDRIVSYWPMDDQAGLP